MAGRPDPLAPPPPSGRAADAARLAQRERAPADPLQAMMGCPPPVWMNRDTQKRGDGRCVRYTGSGARCSARATHLVWIGCTTGEHLDKSAMCGPHAEALAHWKALHCLRCWDALGIISDARVIKIEQAKGE